MPRKGFTLIEIIMAMAIMAVGIIGVVRLLPVGLKASRSSEMMSKAAFLAQKKIEEFKLAGVEQIISGEEITLEGEEGAYAWVAEVSEASLAGVADSSDILHLTLTVSWQDKGRSSSQEFVTYIGR